MMGIGDYAACSPDSIDGIFALKSGSLSQGHSSSPRACLLEGEEKELPTAELDRRQICP